MGLDRPISVASPMSPFPWHPVDLSLWLALAPHAWFEPLIEWYTPPSDFSHGTYFGLARLGEASDRCGYLAVQDFHGNFQECEFPLEELEALEKTLKSISIEQRSGVGIFDRDSGLIRVYQGPEVLDRLLLSERRGAGVGTVFGFHPRNDRVVHALAAGGQLGPAGRTPAGGTRLAAQNGHEL